MSSGKCSGEDESRGDEQNGAGPRLRWTLPMCLQISHLGSALLRELGHVRGRHVHRPGAAARRGRVMSGGAGAGHAEGAPHRAHRLVQAARLDVCWSPEGQEEHESAQEVSTDRQP